MKNLTPRELDVLKLLGNPISQISNKLFIAPCTVKTHLQSLFNKTGTSSQIELIIFSLDKKIITLDDLKKSINSIK